MDLITNNLPIVIIVVLVLAAIAVLLLRPRQRVQLTDTDPRSAPHGAVSAGRRAWADGRSGRRDQRPHRGDFRGARPSRTGWRRRAGGRLHPDERRRAPLRGIAAGLGFNRFEQLAALSPTEIERLDDRFGAFKGRLTRDRVVEQADYCPATTSMATSRGSASFS